MIRLMLGFVAAVAVTGGAVAQPAVERGGYLVNTIMTCGNCHTPKGPPAAVAGKDFSGGLQLRTSRRSRSRAPNITPDKDTGIGNWTDAQIKKALLHRHAARTACRSRRGHADGVLPILTPGDLDAIVAYLRSRSSRCSNKVPDPVYKIALPRSGLPGRREADPAAPT